MIAPPIVPWGALEAFVLVLYLSSGLLFILGAQAVRGVIRGLPYAVSLVLLIVWLSRGIRSQQDWPRKRWLILALAVLGLGLLHPEANLFGGLGQILFQGSIAAPFLWLQDETIDQSRLRRLLSLIFLGSAASAVVGLLQFFTPVASCLRSSAVGFTRSRATWTCWLTPMRRGGKSSGRPA